MASASIDPTTGQPLPADAIQRVLFVAPKVHVYQIPPLTSTKGYTAATWTEDPKRHIFTARLRVLETGIDTDDDDDSNNSPENVKVDIILEDPSSGQLFAAAPYTSAAVIEAALDSARFFAVRVQDGQGRKATLGIGFEERPEAFDFGVALQEARKTTGQDSEDEKKGASSSAAALKKKQEEEAAAKRDYSLKEGETITVNLSGSKFGRRSHLTESSSGSGSSGLSGFSLPPPPPPASSSSGSFSLPPPPGNPRTANRQSAQDASTSGKKSAAELGFDDGQFGEFA